jgi:hypothetical protein
MAIVVCAHSAQRISRSASACTERVLSRFNPGRHVFNDDDRDSHREIKAIRDMAERAQEKKGSGITGAEECLFHSVTLVTWPVTAASRL